MGGQPVPDDEKRALKMLTEMTQEDNRVGSLNRVFEIALQNASRQGQSNHRREFAAFAHPSQHRGVPNRCPRQSDSGAERKARLVNEDDFCPKAPGFFLMRGQSCLSQASTNSSSRSLAWTAGICALHPNALRRAAR